MTVNMQRASVSQSLALAKRAVYLSLSVMGGGGGGGGGWQGFHKLSVKEATQALRVLQQGRPASSLCFADEALKKVVDLKLLNLTNDS